MPMAHPMQGSRFELKYLISEECAHGIRDFIRSYLVPDKFAAIRPNHEYPVHSLYLDSADYALCRATMQGQKNRFKLRVRFYTDLPDDPVYFEIKRRTNDAIQKRRAAVRRSSMPRLLAGHWPEMADLVDPEGADFGVLQNFSDLQDRVRAAGRVFVSYMREAYVSENDNSVRITFDRGLLGDWYLAGAGLRDGLRGERVNLGATILEVKFTDRFPNWARDMAQVFGLQRRSVAKYVHCVSRLSEMALPAGYQGTRL